MADELIGDAAEATAAEGGAVLLLPNPEAIDRERVASSDPLPDADAHCGHCLEHEVRIQELESRIATHALIHQELRTDIGTRAASAHDHPTDEDVRIVADELRALREEEVAPRRGVIQRGWLLKLGRGQRSA